MRKYRNYVARIRYTVLPFSLLWRTSLGWLIAAVCIRQCDCTTRRRAATKANALVDGGSLSGKTNASSRLHLRSLLRVTVVRGARNTFTIQNRGKYTGRTKLETGWRKRRTMCERDRCTKDESRTFYYLLWCVICRAMYLVNIIKIIIMRRRCNY